MNQLCLTTDLTSAELASWVQAIGSIAAILGAAWVAWFQTQRQFKNELQLQKAALAAHRAEAGRTLMKLVENSADAMLYVSEKLSEREAVHRVAQGQASCGLGELGRLETYLRAIPLHDLPDTLVTPALVLVSTLGQFKEKVELVLRLHRTMTAENFEDFFKTMNDMKEAVTEARGDIEKEVAPNVT